MINQMSQNENTQNQFASAIKELQIGKLLRKANITKSCGISAYELFQFLLLLVFQGKNLFRFLNSKWKDLAVSKNTYYRFLNDTSFHWVKFLSLLSARVASAFSALTGPERVKVLVLDDSVVKRSEAKPWSSLHGYMTMWSINTRKDLPCLHWDSLTDIVLYRLASTCFPRRRKATAIRKCLIKSTAAPTVTEPGSGNPLNPEGAGRRNPGGLCSYGHLVHNRVDAG